MIILGDCLAGLRALPSNCIDAVVTDPPYDIENVKAGGNNTFTKTVGNAHSELKENNITSGFDLAVLDELVRVCRTINMYFFCNKAQIPMYIDYFVKGHGCSFDLIKWVKTNSPPTFNGKWLSDTEYCFVARKKSHCKPANYQDASTLYQSPMNVADKKKYGHPTPKPVPLLRRIIRNSTLPGQVVCDPFAGSGSTPEACALEGREVIAFELLEEYYTIATARYQEALTCAAKQK